VRIYYKLEFTEEQKEDSDELTCFSDLEDFFSENFAVEISESIEKNTLRGYYLI